MTDEKQTLYNLASSILGNRDSWFFVLLVGMFVTAVWTSREQRLFMEEQLINSVEKQNEALAKQVEALEAIAAGINRGVDAGVRGRQAAWSDEENIGSELYRQETGGIITGEHPPTPAGVGT